jgi:hypothetical protein
MDIKWEVTSKSMTYQLTTDGGVVRLAAIETKHSDSIAYIESRYIAGLNTGIVIGEGSQAIVYISY